MNGSETQVESNPKYKISNKTGSTGEVSYPLNKKKEGAIEIWPNPDNHHFACQCISPLIESLFSFTLSGLGTVRGSPDKESNISLGQIHYDR